MNKITIDDAKKVVIKDSSIIELKAKEVVLSIINDVDLFIELKCNCNLTIDVTKSLNLNIFNLNKSLNLNINLNFLKAMINCNYSNINIDDNTYTVNINHNYKETVSYLNSNGLNLKDNKLIYVINTNIPKDAILVKSDQVSNIILKGKNNSVIKPNLIVANSNVVANHAAYLGFFKKDAIFYLNSRGIKTKEAEKILAKAHLIGKMILGEAEKELITNSLNDNWR